MPVAKLMPPSSAITPQETRCGERPVRREHRRKERGFPVEAWVDSWIDAWVNSWVDAWVDD